MGSSNSNPVTVTKQTPIRRKSEQACSSGDCCIVVNGLLCGFFIFIVISIGFAAFRKGSTNLYVETSLGTLFLNKTENTDLCVSHRFEHLSNLVEIDMDIALLDSPWPFLTRMTFNSVKVKPNCRDNKIEWNIAFNVAFPRFSLSFMRISTDADVNDVLIKVTNMFKKDVETIFKGSDFVKNHAYNFDLMSISDHEAKIGSAPVPIPTIPITTTTEATVDFQFWIGPQEIPDTTISTSTVTVIPDRQTTESSECNGPTLTAGEVSAQLLEPFPRIYSSSGFHMCIDANVFSAFPTLEEIALSFDAMKQLPSSLFNGLQNLQSLRIQHIFDLSSIPSSLFSDLMSLKTLLLNNNRLNKLDPTVFKNLISLTDLSLENNKLKEIPKELFTDLMSLETLDLSGNFLHNLDPEWFRGLNNLRNLDISLNPVSTSTFVSFDLPGFENAVRNSCGCRVKVNNGRLFK